MNKATDFFFQTSLDSILNGFLNEDSNTTAMLEDLLQPRYHIGDIGIDRNTFIYWLNKKLMPYQKQHQREGWRKFSFFECVWLKVILEFRALGLSIERIKKVKDLCFDVERFVDQIVASTKSEVLKQAGFGDYVSKFSHLSKKEMVEGFRKKELSMFEVVVIASLAHKNGINIAITKQNDIGFILLGRRKKEYSSPNVYTIIQELLSGSFIMVNLWPLILDLLYYDGIKVSVNVVSNILTPEEHHILLAMRSGNYSEILVKMDKDGQPTHVELKKQGVDQNAIRKLYPYLKKGKYEHIQFKTRDGKIISYEETQVVKFRNSN